MKPTEYVAQFTTSVQITDSDWKIVRPSLKIDDSTTIGEIIKWMADIHRSHPVSTFEVITLDTIK